MTSSKSTIGEGDVYILEAAPLDETTGDTVTGATVTYEIFNSTTGASVTSGTLSEQGSTGYYTASYTFSTAGDFRIVYNSSGYPAAAESVAVMDFTTDIDDILADTVKLNKIQCNRWKLDAGANTMTIYEDDQTTPFLVFDMKDASAVASVNRIFERVPQ